MTNGLGASFGALLLVAILAGLAFVLTLAMVAASLFQRRTGPVPQWFSYLVAVLTGAAVLVAGFAVIALSDEAATLAVVFAALVLAPLSTSWISLYRHTTLSPLELLATSGLAWGLPFLLGVTTTFGGLDLATRAFDIAPAETRRLGLPWIATVMGAAVVVFGTLLIGTRISGTEPAITGSDT